MWGVLYLVEGISLVIVVIVEMQILSIVEDIFLCVFGIEVEGCFWCVWQGIVIEVFCIVIEWGQIINGLKLIIVVCVGDVWYIECSFCVGKCI